MMFIMKGVIVMNNYRYLGVELIPEIFAELIVLLFSGKQFSRQECINTVVDYHKNNGGICNYKSYVSQFKKASLTLRKKGYSLDNVSYGVWRLNDTNKTYDGFWGDSDKQTINSEFAENTKEIGSGDETIYVYYYPTYRKYALLKGESMWYCKVGMTTKNLWDRIYSQSTTCFPEEPFVALIIKCNDAHKLEQTIHNILKMKNKWIENAPGKEWFLTSPDEVKKIYESILN